MVANCNMLTALGENLAGLAPGGLRQSAREGSFTQRAGNLQHQFHTWMEAP